MNNKTNPADIIVFPLDLPSAGEAEAYVRLLSGKVGMFKVGLELFIAAGPSILDAIGKAGDTKIFLDLKLHDIPATVGRAMKRAAQWENVVFATVHCAESEAMLAAAVEGSGGKIGVLGVTVLTSVSGQDLGNAGFDSAFCTDPAALVMKRTQMAHDAGCAGVVCSGHETAAVKAMFGKDFVTMVPGIRPAFGVLPDDQKRVVTPAQAVKNGADYLVIGRPIRDADNPAEAADKIADEISRAFAEV